jgi:hypothetical protein
MTNDETSALRPRQEIKGNKRISSTSNTKKIKAIKKNRKDKGVRGNSLGRNPHSNGLNLL